MAEVQRLYTFDDLSLIDKYAQKFGLDPDWVYDHTSFGTIINFAVMWKEQAEFDDRFQFLWHEINTVPSKL